MRKIAGILSLCLLITALTVPASAAASSENDVEFILEMVSRSSEVDYAWNVEGGRETRTEVPNPTEERVWGWSTCYDMYGEKAKHYTHSRYETVFGTSNDDWSSGRVWGTGKVYAYSPYIAYTTAGELKARVYYGL